MAAHLLAVASPAATFAGAAARRALPEQTHFRTSAVEATAGVPPVRSDALPALAESRFRESSDAAAGETVWLLVVWLLVCHPDGWPEGVAPLAALPLESD